MKKEDLFKSVLDGFSSIDLSSISEESLIDVLENIEESKRLFSFFLKDAFFQRIYLGDRDTSTLGFYGTILSVKQEDEHSVKINSLNVSRIDLLPIEEKEGNKIMIRKSLKDFREKNLILVDFFILNKILSNNFFFPEKWKEVKGRIFCFGTEFVSGYGIEYVVAIFYDTRSDSWIIQQTETSEFINSNDVVAVIKKDTLF